MFKPRIERLSTILGIPPANIGHRGARGLAPENTLVSFLVGSDSTRFFELDTMLCGSGELVVIHDFTVDRTTDGKGKVADYKYRALAELDAGSFFEEAFEGEQIPTLSQVIQTMPENTVFDIEMKSEGKKEERQTLASALVKLIRKYKLTNRIWVSSFDWDLVNLIRQEEPEVLRGLLMEKGDSLNESYKNYEPDLILPHLSACTKEFVQGLKEESLLVIPYTTNTEEEWKQLLEVGVAGLITDYPDRLAEFLESKK
ncbi:glycerophosphodiester phosphodiesterase family protein [Leptospira wolbachii serovar Codice str. CDC]|uniref:Glycerophosphodiester phosphodiesterase family protein n=1 Tax=Leptospira wolbachii serovar Codice str. CDC TaxID=1218599 RepID=R9ADN4_9LEPT|nr:glycerophosphodiester phosphodiesterase family protein [Leptospira wolbachii]EOQ98240.1 glycerophosphodiester phosphodiesterase family protein [Leptospira wolbachii serovar Codice str. CDC]